MLDRMLGELPEMAETTPEKPERLRMPSARIAVSILDDADTLTLMHRGRSGIYALWAFTALLILAKTMKKNGYFKGPIAKYAGKIGLSPTQLENAISEIEDAAKENDNEPWIVRDGSDVYIRQWDKWNKTEAGGPRRGAGRPPKKIKSDSSLIPLDYDLAGETESKSGPPVPSPVPSPDLKNQEGKLRIVGTNEGGREPITDALRAAGVAGVALRFLPTVPGMTLDAVRDATAPYAGGRAPPGIIIGRLCSRFNVTIPGKSQLAPDIAAAVNAIQARRPRT